MGAGWHFWLLVLGALVFAAVINLQFVHGSNLHHEVGGHDEYLTVREVNAILHPLSMKHWFMSVISGSMLYYGRIMYNMDALVAWLPDKIWGISGMVYAIRMFHTVLLLASVVMLVRLFVQNRIRQTIFLAGALVLGYTWYFVLVPKPEPHQLFFLTLFLWFYVRKNAGFGWHFLWLGLAYGVKFNILTAIPVLVLWSVIQHGWPWKSIIRSVLWALAGIVLANPCLLLSPVRPQFLKTYIADTFGNAGHLADVAEVGFGDWFSGVWSNLYNGGWVFTVICMGMMLTVLIREWLAFRQTGKPGLPLLLLLLGLSLMLPVFITTHRLWPHYIWTGHLFIWLSVCAMLPGAKFGARQNAMLLIMVAGMSLTAAGSLKNISSREKSQQELISQSLRARDYVFSHPGKVCVLTEWSVYLSFEDFGRSVVFHPFQGPMPAAGPEKSIIPKTPVSWEEIQQNDAQFLILNKGDFMKSISRNAENEEEKLNRIAAEKLRGLLGKNILRDTAFGPLIVYKIIK